MNTQKAIETLSSEALKPVSKVIDAVIGPKLQRISTWAKKKELTDRLQEKVINELLDQYFKRLLRRVSGITTIVFPQQMLPLASIYEPLSLAHLGGSSFTLKLSKENITLTAKDLQSDQNYLIIDSAGMGKSTFSKHLVLDIFQSTTKIPLFLELRRIEENETLLGRLSKEIDEDQEDIDEKFLGVLLDQGGYVIILDAFDELSENARHSIGQQIADLAVKYDQNMLILTSRPEVPLPEISRSKVYGIQPLNQAQAKSLVLRYDSWANHTVGKGLIGEFNQVSDEFLQTPLLLVLLYRTYSLSQTIATNVATFYNDVYNAFYRGHDLTKSGFSRTKLSGLDLENFRRLLRGIAFLLITENKYGFKSATEAYPIIEKAIRLTSVTPSSVPNFFEDVLTAVPLLIKDGNEYRFIHKSIAEFFAAEYLAYLPDAEKKIRMIIEKGISWKFSRSIDFLADLNPSLFRRAIVGPLAKSFLAKKKLSKDPLPRTLQVMGVTRIALEAPGEEYHHQAESWSSITTLLPYPAEGFKLVFIIEGFSPSFKATRMLRRGDSALNPRLNLSDTISQEDREELFALMKKGFITTTEKTFLKIFDNPIFRENAFVVAHYRVFDDEVCQNILNTIEEEDKAQKQIDEILFGS